MQKTNEGTGDVPSHNPQVVSLNTVGITHTGMDPGGLQGLKPPAYRNGTLGNHAALRNLAVTLQV